MKIVVVWDVTLCGSYNNDVSEERITSVIRVIRIGVLGTTLTVTRKRSAVRRNTRLLDTANAALSSPILITLMIEAIRSSETSVLIGATLFTNNNNSKVFCVIKLKVSWISLRTVLYIYHFPYKFYEKEFLRS
jgi:hypothetical protein